MTESDDTPPASATRNDTRPAKDSDDTRRAIARVWRDEAPRVVGCLTRILRDVSLAEDFGQDALLTALDEWPRTGIPERPGAWLITTARNRALNHLRRTKVADRASEQLARTGDRDATRERNGLEAQMTEPLKDDVLRLIFTACHPVLSKEARVALTLKLIGGLTTDEIARAFLVGEPTIAQRIVRAKKTLGEAGVPFEVPIGAELEERLASVLEVVYLIFNEGYAATSGDDLMRPGLAAEAIRIGGLLTRLTPNEPEVFGLYAVMELQHSRAATRVDAEGEPILLEHQDRSRWDRFAIERGRAAIEHANHVLGERPMQVAGPYLLQAEIAECHAASQRFEDTDWKRIAALYQSMHGVVRPVSPIIELNRAMAISRADGPAPALKLLDALRKQGALASYHLLHAARAELLEKLGRRDEARREFERAAELTDNARQKARLLARAANCAE